MRLNGNRWKYQTSWSTTTCRTSTPSYWNLCRINPLQTKALKASSLGPDKGRSMKSDKSGTDAGQRIWLITSHNYMRALAHSAESPIIMRSNKNSYRSLRSATSRNKSNIMEIRGEPKAMNAWIRFPLSALLLEKSELKEWGRRVSSSGKV